MDRIGLFGPAPRVAVAVSGGADSTALAFLAARWASARGGSVVALIVDHGLRAESGTEAALTATRLRAMGLEAEILPLLGLRRGAALAERARAARYEALLSACAERGLLHLLLGHHRADQAETVVMRGRAGSGARGLAGMSAVVETGGARLLRPLLGTPPLRLRHTLRAAGLSWVEDPSNADPAAERNRVRAALGAEGGDTGDDAAALHDAIARAAAARADQDSEVAAELARVAAIRAEGFAVVTAPALSTAALAALLQAISGGPFPPATRTLAALARGLAPATAGGTRVMRAGRGGHVWLFAREARRLQPAVPAAPGTLWDGRFRLSARAVPLAGAMVGALGPEDAATLRRGGNAKAERLPSAVLKTMPAVRGPDGTLFAVPHLAYPDREVCEVVPIAFEPRRPAACASFLGGCGVRAAG